MLSLTVSMGFPENFAFYNVAVYFRSASLDAIPRQPSLRI
jgi:hypothetical protein